jgi:hypothetical protein
MAERPESPEIPSFFQALRCSCGKARLGPYCDGSHLGGPPEPDCKRGEGAPREPRSGPGTGRSRED